MGSLNKWKKWKHSNADAGAMKLKNSKGKKFLWFTAAQRRWNNNFDKSEVDE